MGTNPNSNTTEGNGTLNTFAGADQRFSLANNLDNITKIQRMWKAQWPEFSWVTVPGDENSRCYQMFAPDISRVGYGDPVVNGNSTVYAIMCPQQGLWIPFLEGTLNIEVTVTSSGGQVNEVNKFIDAQMTIMPKIWFSPDTLQKSPLIQLLWQLFQTKHIPFPSSKANAIVLTAFGVDSKDKPNQSTVLDVKSGLDTNFKIPPFAMHEKEAWSVANVAVEIGQPVSTGNAIADSFNALIMKIFNLASGNLLAYQNVLSWNVWVSEPEAVFTKEWEIHADYWRFSIDVNHRSPEGNGRDPQYYDGTKFDPAANLIKQVLTEIWDWIKSHFGDSAALDNEFTSLLSKPADGEVGFL